jgi:hypothetical protein
VRLFVPLLDGTDRVGVLVFTLDSVDDHDCRLTRRLAGLVADMLITKSMYTDRFFQAWRRQPMSLSAEMQWQLLPPLMMTTPQVAVAGALEPAYDVAVDSFDYALNDNILHLAMIDATGHGLSAAVMATLAIGAYRHARRLNVGLDGLYAAMDEAITSASSVPTGLRPHRWRGWTSERVFLSGSTAGIQHRCSCATIASLPS